MFGIASGHFELLPKSTHKLARGLTKCFLSEPGYFYNNPTPNQKSEAMSSSLFKSRNASKDVLKEEKNNTTTTLIFYVCA